MMKALLKQAKLTIEKIQYLNLATVSEKGDPWNSPIYISYDKDLNFYWMSWKENIHSVNIRNNSKIFATIYDSTVAAGEGFGVYLQGNAFELHNPKDILIGLATHYQRVDKKARAIKEFLTKFPRRVYRFTPDRVWVNGDGEIDGNVIDVRTELDFEELKKMFRF